MVYISESDFRSFTESLLCHRIDAVQHSCRDVPFPDLCRAVFKIREVLSVGCGTGGVLAVVGRPAVFSAGGTACRSRWVNRLFRWLWDGGVLAVAGRPAVYPAGGAACWRRWVNRPFRWGRARRRYCALAVTGRPAVYPAGGTACWSRWVNRPDGMGMPYFFAVRTVAPRPWREVWCRVQ